MRVLSAFLVSLTLAAASIPSPESVLGHKPTDDFYLATYEESLSYFKKLASATDQLKLITIGNTTQGREWQVALISSAANLRQIDKYKDIARRLALVKGLDDEQAKALAREGKAIIHIDGGLHANEVAGQQHTIQLAYELLTIQDQRVLDNVIIMLWPSINPDGQTMIAEWYRRNVGTEFEVAPTPFLYQDYVGHDNNRDGYMLNMIESKTVVKTQLEYFPQIMYTHHQTAPFPARIWIPPVAEPITSDAHPSMWRWLNTIGTYIAAYLDQNGMPGAMHRGRFDVWYSGYLDNIGMWRNQVSFFTETALYRYATPRFYTIDEFPREKQDLRAEGLYASPWRGGWWRIGDAVRYMTAASWAVLDLAAKNREELLLNRYQAGRDTIRRFETEPPFVYRIPFAQHDKSAGALLVDRLLLNGIEVRQTADAWLIPMNQPFAGLVQNLFEVQKYPDLPDFPYDVTGWTLPLQMGVEVTQLDKLPKDTSMVTRTPFEVPAPPVKPKRVGLYRPWTASMDEGWTRWILEQRKYPFTNLYNADVQAGHLHERFDTIILPDIRPQQLNDGYARGVVPGQYAGGLGKEGLDALRAFVAEGGTVVTFNQSSNWMIDELKLPVTNVLAGLKAADFNCPGALLAVQIAEHPLTRGLPPSPTIMFERGPAFETKSGFKGTVLATYPSDQSPLRSGYLRGGEKLYGKAAALAVSYGKGQIVLLGFRPQWRGQSIGSYRFFLNALEN
jgi:hypothetical protein